MKIWQFLVGGEGRRAGGSGREGEEILDKLFKLSSAGDKQEQVGVGVEGGLMTKSKRLLKACLLLLYASESAEMAPLFALLTPKGNPSKKKNSTSWTGFFIYGIFASRSYFPAAQAVQ